MARLVEETPDRTGMMNNEQARILEVAQKIEQLREDARLTLPASRQLALANTKLQEAVFWLSDLLSEIDQNKGPV
jgi:uncharacterized phage infection (PIP) family protein YhgE